MVSLAGVTLDKTTGGVLNYADWVNYDQSGDSADNTIDSTDADSVDTIASLLNFTPTVHPKFGVSNGTNSGLFDSFRVLSLLKGGSASLGWSGTSVLTNNSYPVQLGDNLIGIMADAGFGISNNDTFDIDTTHASVSGDCRSCDVVAASDPPQLCAFTLIRNTSNPRLVAATAELGRGTQTPAITFNTSLSLITTTPTPTSEKCGKIDDNNFACFYATAAGGIFATKVNWDGAALTTVGTANQNINTTASLDLLACMDISDTEFALILYSSSQISVLPVRLSGSTFTAGTLVNIHSWTGGLYVGFAYIGGGYFALSRHNGTALSLKIVHVENNVATVVNTQSLTIGASNNNYGLTHADGNNLALLYEDSATSDLKFRLLVP